MTKEQAIKILKADETDDYSFIWDELGLKGTEDYNRAYDEAYDMAIQALELVSDFETARIISDGRLNGRTSAYKCGLMDGLRLSGEKIKLEFMAESERDCKTCKHSINGNCAGTEECHECMWDNKYEQQPKIGYWKWQLADNGWADHICSECGFKHNTDIHVTLNWKYCPNCGVKMEAKK